MEIFMNTIFVFFLASAIIYALFCGNPNEIFDIITKSLNDSGAFIMKIAFLTGFFSGIMRIAEESGITDKLCGFIKKIIGRIFETKNETAKNYISLNIAANMIGIGNAATPAGLSAMEELDRDNKGRKFPSRDMCKFILFNTCSVQIIPTTVMSLRALYGSKNPSDIILPVLIVSISSLVFAMVILNVPVMKW